MIPFSGSIDKTSADPPAKSEETDSCAQSAPKGTQRIAKNRTKADLDKPFTSLKE